MNPRHLIALIALCEVAHCAIEHFILGDLDTVPSVVDRINVFSNFDQDRCARVCIEVNFFKFGRKTLQTYGCESYSYSAMTKQCFLSGSASNVSTNALVYGGQMYEWWNRVMQPKNESRRILRRLSLSQPSSAAYSCAAIVACKFTTRAMWPTRH